MNTLRRARASALALTAVTLSVALTVEGASAPPPGERVAAHLAMTVLPPGGVEETTAPVPQMTTPPPRDPAPPVPAAAGAPHAATSDKPDRAEPRRIIPFGSVIARAADGSEGNGAKESAEDVAAKAAVEAADAARQKVSNGKGRARRAARALPWRKRLGFQWPVHGWVTSHFGPRRSGFHHGVDVACRRGIKVRTAKAGRVLLARALPVYGKAVIVRHPGGYTTLYGHMNRLFVRPGQRLHDRRVIGACGSTGNSTGNHVHFELRHKGRYLKPGHFLPSR